MGHAVCRLLSNAGFADLAIRGLVLVAVDDGRSSLGLDLQAARAEDSK